MKQYTMDEKREIYKKWRSLINMDLSELEKWLKNPWKMKASLSKDQATAHGIVSGHTSFNQIMNMVEMTFKDWEDEDFYHARRHNSFNSRMLGNNPGKPVSSDVPMSKWEISLRNWGHDPRKSNSPGKDKVEAWLKDYFPEKEASDKNNDMVDIIKIAAMGLRNVHR